MKFIPEESRCQIVTVSEHMKLDSDVTRGGGTDQTAQLQKLLDLAKDGRSLYLIMDGAALVSRLRIYSNTTIHCLNNRCGFFQKGGTSNSLLENASLSYKEITTENITLIGGTYNFNSPEQEREDLPENAFDCLCVYSIGDAGFNTETGFHRLQHTHMGFKFCGIRNLVIRDLTTVNQRIYAMWFICFEHILIENVAVELSDNRYGQNQDGLHFHGPGRDLVIRNIRGCSGDDFIALAPDEFDFVSDITDVLIDGVYLENADQGIRLLSRDAGRLDRVTIRNVYGTYKSFGFLISPWYGGQMGGKKGNIGSIAFENINLQATEHKYSYAEPCLFRISGQIDTITLENIRDINPSDNRVLIDIGGYKLRDEDSFDFADITYLSIEGMTVINKTGHSSAAEYIRVSGKIKYLSVNDSVIERSESHPDDVLVLLKDGGEIQTLALKGNRISSGHLLAEQGGYVQTLLSDSGGLESI